MPDPRPIGVFDSGVGGLTVLREIVRRSPAESTIYLGDNARAPYGVRSDDEVLAFSAQSLDRLAERDVKAIVVACNTSTAVAIGALRRRYDLPILGVIRPGASAAALATRNRRVGVIATPGDDPLPRLFRGDQGREPGDRGLRARDADARAAGRGRRAGRADRRSRRGRLPGAAARRARRGRRVDLPAAAGRHDRHAPPRLHPLPAAAGAHRGDRRGPRRDRRFGDGDGVGAGRAPEHQRARGRGTGRVGEGGPTNGADAAHGATPAARPPSRRAISSSRPAIRPRSTPSPAGCSGRPSRRWSRSTSRWRPDERPTRPIGRPAGLARRPGVAGRVPDRVGAGGGRDGRRPACRAVGSQGRPDRLAGGRAHRHQPAAQRPRHPRCGRAASGRAGLRGGDGPDRAGPDGGARQPLAGGRRAVGCGRPGGLGARQHRLVRVADVEAREGPARPGHAARRRPRQGDRRAGQSLGLHPPARVPARVHGQPRPRPVRPGPPVHRSRAGQAALRRGEHPGHGTCAGRPARPVPDVDRPPRDDPRLRVRGAPVAPAVPGRSARAPADAVRQGRPRAGPRSAPRAGPVDPRRGRRRALDRTDDGTRAEGALPRDAGRHEPARGVQRLRHGRGRARPGAGRRPDQPAVPRAPDEADAVREVDAPDHRHGPQARAVPQGRAVRAGPSPSAAGRPRCRRLWAGPETLPRDGEIEAPDRWIARVLDGPAG